MRLLVQLMVIVKHCLKVEDNIGKPLSPYAVTKYVNELYADVFGTTYDTDVIGLRYFNVFGPKQSPNGAYAAVIPLFMQALKIISLQKLMEMASKLEILLL